ncbi:MAG TPA: hypothetical protein DCK95_12745 [Anaerolineaceae bacterium]|nr:hypothetical protein [Anaerolineaceae bacterium]
MCKNFVVIKEAAPMDYLVDYVALPKNYGTDAYYARADVKEIRRTVFEALDKLNALIDLKQRIRRRKIIIKPNLVGVYHNSGFRNVDMPQSTDPRVFEAIVDYLTRFSDKITIAESAGGGIGTGSYFKIAGYDKIAKRYNTDLVVLEEQPIDRYMLPKAKVMKEICIPRLLSEVVRGEAYYVSVPKMKTNLYTGVTLGFKNAMGTLPANLRYRNHNYDINKKLVDLLYLFKPDLTVIDGIVGAEGLTPGPVDPVDMRMIVASNNSIEADRITTKMMGFDPEQNELIKEAVSRGFGDPNVEIIGTPKIVKFRPADKSLMSDRFKSNFPNVKMLVGLTKNNPLTIKSIDEVTPQMVREMELACGGGCLPAMAQVFEMYLYTKKPSDTSFALVILYGEGVLIDDKRYYFDSEGKVYDIDTIQALPMKKYAIGECARAMDGKVDSFTGGCCDISACTFGIGKVTGLSVPQMSLSNKGLFSLISSVLTTYRTKRRWVKQGEYVDVPYKQEDFDKIFPIPELTPEQVQMDHIEWPFPKMTRDEIKQNLKAVKLM